VQGKYVRLLEDHVSRFAGVKETKAVASGTAALHLALLALGVGPGDEVIVPAFSFVATANVVELVGATPIFVDVDLSTFNIDPDKIQAAISPRTRAIMPVHEFGLICDIERISALADSYGLPVVEDAACAIGATSAGRQAGSFGIIGCFSLHPRKVITSGEGGLVLTRDAELAHRVDVLRNHGIDQSDGEKKFADAGYNYRLSDIHGALVYAQALRLEQNLASRARLAEVYEKEICHAYVTLPVTPEGNVHSWQTYHVLLDDRIHRADVIAYLQLHGIQTGPGAQCIPDEPYYQKKYALDTIRQYPNANRAARQGLVLPMAETLTTEEVRYVATRLNEYSE
jgi:dTDP-4-amino-4,6-dideoxygalactose transaminase